MNVDTGELMALSEHLSPEETKKLLGEGYEPVPKELELAARKKLAGQSEAQVSLTSGGKLSKWAAGRRKDRRKMAAESRRRNRG